MTIFFKAVIEKVHNYNYIPGTVTTDINEAYIWKCRLESKKNKGASKHIPHGKAIIISFNFDSSELKSHEYFQVTGVHEHNKENCWTSTTKTKAQINTPISNYEILTNEQIALLLTR